MGVDVLVLVPPMKVHNLIAALAAILSVSLVGAEEPTGPFDELRAALSRVEGR